MNHGVLQTFLSDLATRFGDDLAVVQQSGCVRITVEPSILADVTARLHETGAILAGIVAEQEAGGFRFHYPFCATGMGLWVIVELKTMAGELVPSISSVAFAADWHEREIEDLFALHFSGHPLLGDFVLHDEIWPEGVAPMTHSFSPVTPCARKANPDYVPPQIVEAPGSFTMPVGPIYGGITESAQFFLETVGEEVIFTRPRFFYKYRGIEKVAEGREPHDLLLFAERLNGQAAFAHGLACAQALETLGGTSVPPRAQWLRVMWAELERLRSHTATIAGICKSTGLSVPTNLAYSLVESLLRLAGEYAGHRYLFGLLRPGGLACDLPNDRAIELTRRSAECADRLSALGKALSFDNSFLDRLEEVGVIEPDEARLYGLVGPVGRASGCTCDLRVDVPYAAYRSCAPVKSMETEGDGYARLRVFLAEALESAHMARHAADSLPPGPVSCTWRPCAGRALGWAEAPAGTTCHFVSIDEDGRVGRYRLMPPAFSNWHAFQLAAENFAFQDFPITLATVGLSIAESDR
ncbi:NADH-quinone oxidoreductase subunit C [Paraburkholderia sp. J12]|uniref:hydrogenase large subunit n=1 Tax=Paraburkholderia sp. J12 TaxID=2805432 RepID=UPI002ABE20A3|nr:NADH-quinone oxidoreductase subunit C [Paraburkholderia sp. J12]